MLSVYIRFAIHRKNEDSGRALGIFHAAMDLRDFGEIEPWERNLLLELRDWFNENLEAPDRFTASKPPYNRKQSKAISWFKDTAVEHIGRARQMVEILESHGVAVDTYMANRVGYVVYEDDYQIVAEAFSDLDC
jgi:hypothetical protein